jgi:hypothetical protein
MIWNTVHGEDRLILWKKLRADLKDLPVDKQLNEVAKFCAGIPFGARSLDYYSPADWPTPWEILYHGSFCTSSISLLIYYTLAMIPIAAKLDLYLVEDEDGVCLLPVVNDQFVLNRELGQVSMYLDACADVTLLKIYPQDQIKTIT